MISENIIKKLAERHQTSELNIRREYFQHLFLSYFYKQKQADKIYFKGGTALRLVYNSPRFSEDLDFSSSLKDIKVIEQAVVETLAGIEREGIQTEIEEAKETTGGYLATANFKTNGRVTPIQTEISFRNDKKTGEVTAVTSDLLPLYTIIQLSKDQLVEGKIAALLSRKKPRDFYDLYFMLRANLIPTEKKEMLLDALNALNSVNIRFDQELKKFLPKSHWPIIRDFPAVFEREIKRFL